MTAKLHKVSTIFAILLSGGLFGFFFTMSFSIMPGLDQTEPYSALLANKMIGRATQNSFFVVLMLGTPLAILLGIVGSLRREDRAGLPYLVLAILSWLLVLATTLIFNVPLNQILDGLTLVPNMKNASEAWEAYSVEWQRWNLFRVGFSFLAALLTVLALNAQLIHYDRQTKDMPLQSRLKRTIRGKLGTFRV